MNQQEALVVLRQNLSNYNLIKHCLATEAIMRSLAECFHEDKERWGLAGLLHDIDYEKTKDSPMEHSLVGALMLEEMGLETEIVQAVRTHNERHGIPQDSLMGKALYVTDPLTGLVVASALVLPSRKIVDLTLENILNRFSEKSFAKGANREIIKKCKEFLGLELEEFVKIGLLAMQAVAGDIGLQ